MDFKQNPIFNIYNRIFFISMSIYKSGTSEVIFDPETGQPSSTSIPVSKHDFGAIYYSDTEGNLRRIRRVWNANMFIEGANSLKYVWPNHKNLFKFGLTYISSEKGGLYIDKEYEDGYHPITNDNKLFECYPRLYPFNTPDEDYQIKTNHNYTDVEKYTIYVSPGDNRLNLYFRNCNYRYNKKYDLKISDRADVPGTTIGTDFIRVLQIKNENNTTPILDENILYDNGDRLLVNDTTVTLQISANNSLVSERYGTVVFEQYNQFDRDNGYYTGKIVVLNIVQLRDRIVKPNYNKIQWYADETCTVEIGSDIQYPEITSVGGEFTRYFKIIGNTGDTLNNFNYGQEIYYKQIDYLHEEDDPEISILDLESGDLAEYCKDIEFVYLGEGRYKISAKVDAMDLEDNEKINIYASNEIEDISGNDFKIPNKNTDGTARFKILKDIIIDPRKFYIKVDCNFIENALVNSELQETQKGYEEIGINYTREYLNGVDDINDLFIVDVGQCTYGGDDHENVIHQPYHDKSNIYNIEILPIDDYIYVRLFLNENNIPRPTYTINNFSVDLTILYSTEFFQGQFSVYKQSNISVEKYYYISLKTENQEHNVNCVLNFIHEAYTENIRKTLDLSEIQYEVLVSNIQDYDINKEPGSGYDFTVNVGQNINNETRMIIKDVQYYKKENSAYKQYTGTLPGNYVSDNPYYIGCQLYKSSTSSQVRTINTQIKLLKCEEYDVEILSDIKTTTQSGYGSNSDELIQGQLNGFTVKNLVDNVICNGDKEEVGGRYYFQLVYENNNNNVDESKVTISPPYIINVIEHGYSIEGIDNKPCEICNFKIRGTLKGETNTRELNYQIAFTSNDEEVENKHTVINSPIISQDPLEDNLGPSFINATEENIASIVPEIITNNPYLNSNVEPRYQVVSASDDPKLFILYLFVKNDEYRNGNLKFFGRDNYMNYNWQESPTNIDITVPYTGIDSIDGLRLETRIEDIIDETVSNDIDYEYYIKYKSDQSQLITTSILYSGPTEGTVDGNIEWFEQNESGWNSVTEQAVSEVNFVGKYLPLKFLLNISGKNIIKKYKAQYKTEEIYFNIEQLTGTATKVFIASCKGYDNVTVLNNITNPESFEFNVMSLIASKNVDWKILTDEITTEPELNNNLSKFNTSIAKISGRSAFNVSVSSFADELKKDNTKRFNSNYKIKIPIQQEDYDDGTQVVPGGDIIYVTLIIPRWISNITLI